MDFPVELLRTFLAIIDTGSFTAAAKVVGRTQSAVSMQMRRLENSVNKPLFERQGRSFNLSHEGEALLPYARRMIKLHEETVAALIQPEVTGTVRIGTPDDYAMRFLPSILSRFAQAFPSVQVAVRCEPSIALAEALERGELDLILTTEAAFPERGEIVRRDPVVWVSSGQHLAHEESPLPLAIWPADCVFTSFALQALDQSGMSYRIAYQSASIAGILSAVSAGLAIAYLSPIIVSEGMRILTEADGFPKLLEATIVLHRREGARSRAVETLADYLIEGFRGDP